MSSSQPRSPLSFSGYRLGMTTAFLGTATVAVAAGIAMLTVGVPAPSQLRG